MADIRLTKGNDDYTQALGNRDNGDNIFGEEGDDIIRSYSGNVIGGPGNDTIQKILLPNEPWREIIAAYWDGAPGKIVVDLQAGWALDGWGGRDTLIGVEQAAGSWNENEFYGSNNANRFFLGGGKNLVDGRGGNDTVNLPWFSSTVPAWSDFIFKVSIDGKSALITSPRQASFRVEMKNTEFVALWDGQKEILRPLTDFVDLQDLAIGGLVHNLTNRWNASSPVGTSTEVSFSFVLKAPTSGIGSDQFRAFTASEQAAVRKILLNLSEFTGLSFKELDENSAQVGSIRFGVSQQLNSKGAANFPGENGDAGGDVWMDVESMLNLAVGSEGYAALLHEIGHALGLRHTRNIDPQDRYEQEMLLSYDLTSYTVMSQTPSTDGLFPSTWGAMDISALRYLYGAKAVNVGNNLHVLNDTYATSETSIIDDAGIDTIDAHLAMIGASIDLTPGNLSSFGVTANGIPAVNNISIAKNTWIENAIGSDFDDFLLGNALNNQLTGGKGNDWIDGGLGSDIVIFSGARKDYLLSTAFGKTYVNSRDGVSGFDTLINVEVLRFADQTMTLGSASAGKDVLIGVDQNSQVSGQLFDITDSEILKYALDLKPENGSFELNSSGEYLYVPKANFGGIDSFTYTVTDSKGGTSMFTGFIQINVTTSKIDGGAGNDILRGTVGSDTISGFSGNDLIYGDAGHDTINGGADLDTMVFSGKLSNYKITHSGNSYQVNAKLGNDGNDILTAVEYLQFSDMTVNLTIQDLAKGAPQANVQRLIELYVAFFNRVPDADGLAYWISEMASGKSISQIAEVFYDAGVHFSHLTGFSATMSNTAFINVVYKNVLGRSDGADPGGLEYWNAELVSGKANRGTLVSTILDAAHGFKGDATWGWVANLLDNKIEVAKTFAIDFGLGYASSDEAIRQGMSIAAAVTPTDIQAALSLIGVSTADLALN